VGHLLTRELFAEVRTFARTFLAAKRELFLRRLREGRIRDCHGDLHMKNICLEDGIYIFDCIEFNPRFRYGDVAADIDFLAMDLDFHGLRDLSRHFVGRFAKQARDPELLEVVDFTNVTGLTSGGKSTPSRPRSRRCPQRAESGP
jgi:aminoglycoside phosphotransferase family enzyme